MNYKLGLNRMRSRLSQLDETEYVHLLVLESRLLDCLSTENSFGSAEVSKAEKARVVGDLNALALRTTGMAFNDLCSVQFSLPKSKLVSHNLPHPDYGRFIGREQEVSDLSTELRPYPEGQWPVLIVHGIGGSGKTTLVLEVAWRLVRNYQTLQPTERFDAIVWVTAKQRILTTVGIKSRTPHFRNLYDIFDAIALTLDRPDVIGIDPEGKESIIRQLLSSQRSLLVFDNLETVDDHRIETFLRDIPHPTKAVVTSRYKLEGLPGLPIGLSGMTHEESIALIERECLKEKQNEIILTQTQTEKLYERTAGIPLAVVWSIGLARGGRDIELVLQRLKEADSDIARFCFGYSMDIVREDRKAHLVLMALSLFETEASRLTLGIITGLDQDLDILIEALGKLERLSMISRKEDRYRMLPLARTYAQAETEKYPKFQESIFDRWQLGRDIEVRHIDKLWSEATYALSDKVQDFESICYELAQSLSIVWEMPIIDDSPLQSSRLLGFFIDSKSVFSGTSMPSKTPLLFLKEMKFTEQTIQELLDLREQEVGWHSYQALLLPFLMKKELEAAQSLIEQTLKRLYALDVVVLTREQVLRSIAAQNPQRELKQLGLGQIALVSPFVVTGPAPTHLFFGRGLELQEIVSNIEEKTYAIIGGRRIGKTSLLLRLRQVLPVAGFHSLYLDCSIIASYDEFLAVPIRDWKPNLSLGAPPTFGDLIQSPPSDVFLVMLLDEADGIIANDCVNDWRLLRTLRALVYSGHVQVILSGERILRRELFDPQSPLFNFANEMIVGCLDSRAAEDLVIQPIRNMGIDLLDEKSIVDHIWNFTAGHPNIIQRLCRRLIERLNEQNRTSIKLSDVDAVIEDLSFLRDDFLAIYWEAATPLAKIISLVMAVDKNIRTLIDVKKALNERGVLPKASEVTNALQELVDLRSILRFTSTGYQFAVEAFPHVISKTMSSDVDDFLEIFVEQYEQY